jgi:hypothetical protein
MRSWPAAGLLWWMVGCAASTPRAVTSVAPAPKPADELASAFEPEATPVAANPVARPPPPLPDLRAPFREAADATTRAVAAKDLTAAQQALAQAEAAAKALGVAERQKAAELAFKVAFTSADAPTAQDAARSWLKTCGGDGIDGCRAQALNALLSTSRLDAAAAKAVREEVADLQKAERCVKGAERAKKVDACLSDADAFAKHSKDGFLLAKVAYVRALAAPEGRQPALLTQLDATCDDAACLPVRRKALAQLMAKAKAEKKPDEVARLALKDAHALSTTLPPPERAWGRPPETDVACASFDATQGPGACRKLEKQLFGQWTFRDFSKDKPKEGLSREQVLAVNEHYAPLLQECLAAQAKRLTPPDAVRYEVRWMVFNDGRVGEVHFKQASLDQSELASCLRSQFETWRYPRYEGEWQHVEQAFTVTAVERRSTR